MKKEKKGFTLIELLIVTAIIGILAVVSATVFNSILRSQNKTAIVNEVRQNGNLLIDKLDRDVKQAQSITIGAVPTSIDIVLVTGDTVAWECILGGTFTRDGVSVINDDPTSGVRVVNGLIGPNTCEFTVTPKSPRNTQIVTLEFNLEQRSAVQKAEFQVRVPFVVTVGTRAYH